MVFKGRDKKLYSKCRSRKNRNRNFEDFKDSINVAIVST